LPSRCRSYETQHQCHLSTNLQIRNTRSRTFSSPHLHGRLRKNVSSKTEASISRSAHHLHQKAAPTACLLPSPPRPVGGWVSMPPLDSRSGQHDVILLKGPTTLPSTSYRQEERKNPKTNNLAAEIRVFVPNYGNRAKIQQTTEPSIPATRRYRKSIYSNAFPRPTRASYASK
jgi:hypothetical protein